MLLGLKKRAGLHSWARALHFMKFQESLGFSDLFMYVGGVIVLEAILGGVAAGVHVDATCPDDPLKLGHLVAVKTQFVTTGHTVKVVVNSIGVFPKLFVGVPEVTIKLLVL